MDCKTAVIVLNYNDYETTQKFIDTHIGSPYIDALVVVDNNSTDESFYKLQCNRNEKCSVIKTNKNGGYAYGNNFGANYAITQYNPEMIIIANPDTLISDAAFKKVLSIYDCKEDAAICSCIMSSSACFHTLSAWKQPTYFDCCIACINGLKNMFRWHLEYKDRYFKPNGNPIKEVDVIAGSFFCIKSNIFKEVNGFDDRTFLYYEEAILSYRVKNKGYKNYLATDVSYLHEHAVSINKNIDSVEKRLDILQQSRLLYCKEYLNIGRVKEKVINISYKLGKALYLCYLRYKK